jgi:hypothetical protein
MRVAANPEFVLMRDVRVSQVGGVAEAEVQTLVRRRRAVLQARLVALRTIMRRDQRIAVHVIDRHRRARGRHGPALDQHRVIGDEAIAHQDRAAALGDALPIANEGFQRLKRLIRLKRPGLRGCWAGAGGESGGEREEEKSARRARH